MSGGKLEQSQVIAGDEIIACHGLTTFATLIGFSLTNTVSGHFDISGYGYSIIRESEGFRNQAYKDTGGVWTIGYGTIKYSNGVTVKQGDTCTQGQANLWLMNDCKWVDACLINTSK
jgi:lysozyme